MGLYGGWGNNVPPNSVLAFRVCHNLVKLNLFEKLCEFCQSPDVSIRVVYFTVLGDSDHDCPADGDILIFLLPPPPTQEIEDDAIPWISFSLQFNRPRLHLL